MSSKRMFLAGFLLLAMIFASGCDIDTGRLLQGDSTDDVKLLKVKIYFTDGASLEAYIKDLGIEKDGTIYVGGSSLNYLYDRNGKIVGSYNYQRVLYIMLLPETNSAD